MTRKKINILGINLEQISKNDLFKEIKVFLNSNKLNFVSTVNPEIILEAQKNEEYFNILNQASLSLPDGIGLKFASWFLFSDLKRITGADLTRDLLEFSEKEFVKVGIYNWTLSLSGKKEIESFLKKNYPALKFFVEDCEQNGPTDFSSMKNFGPKIIFVNFGAPHQEKFIYKNAANIESLRLAIGVGGAFDFLTKKIKRSPVFLQKIGLEWCWRIFQEPKGKRMWRLKRIKNAVLVFPVKFFVWRFILPFSYRKNVACLIFKKEEDHFKILVVERSDEKGHWQLIQGGIGNESVAQAASKESTEELGIKDFKIIKTTDFLYKYEFFLNNVHRGGSYSRHTGYRGQKQALAIVQYLGDDKDIKINYWDHSAWKWIDYHCLVGTVHEARASAAEIYLKIFKQEIIEKQYEKN